MRKLTTEEMASLKPYAKNMESAVANDVIIKNITLQERQRLLGLYKNITGKTPKAKLSCTSCYVELLKELSGYVNYVEPKPVKKVKEKADGKD